MNKHDTPKTLHRFKANAKKYAKENDMPHMLGLDEYAKLCGFESYHYAKKYYEENTKENEQ